MSTASILLLYGFVLAIAAAILLYEYRRSAKSSKLNAKDKAWIENLKSTNHGV